MAFDWMNFLTDTAISVAPTLISAALGSSATKDAQASQDAVLREYMALLKANQDKQTETFQPWTDAGKEALGWLTKLATPGAVPAADVGNYLTALPGYGFASDELNKAIDRKQAASGDRFSGRAIKEAIDWKNAKLLQPAYRNWIGDLQTLAGYGDRGNTLVANLNSGTTSALGENLLRMGVNQAGGTIGNYGIMNNALQTAGTDILDAYRNSLKKPGT